VLVSVEFFIAVIVCFGGVRYFWWARKT